MYFSECNHYGTFPQSLWYNNTKLLSVKICRFSCFSLNLRFISISSAHFLLIIGKITLFALYFQIYSNICRTIEVIMQFVGLLIFLSLIFFSLGYKDTDFTVIVPAKRRECFYQPTIGGKTIDIEYQVRICIFPVIEMENDISGTSCLGILCIWCRINCYFILYSVV